MIWVSGSPIGQCRSMAIERPRNIHNAGWSEFSLKPGILRINQAGELELAVPHPINCKIPVELC